MSAIRLRHGPPANDADFELLGLALLRAYWQCPGLDLYAHRGEKQFGVDMVDLTGAQPLSAGQCKLHEAWKTIPPAEIKAEVAKAKEFRPRIERYAILTTARASQEAHDAVLAINRRHRKQGLFVVELITWGKMESLLDRFPDVCDQMSPSISGKRGREIAEKVSAIHEAVVLKRLAKDGPKQPPAPLPKADPRRFAIAVAHLTHDPDQETERLIIESIRDVSGVQILRFDRTIAADGPIPEESMRGAHEQARAMLRESSADVLLWGTVLSHNGRTAPRLCWTTSDATLPSKQPYIPENFELPALFWADLAEILRLLVVTRSAEFFARRGRFIAAELSPFVDKVKTLLKSPGASVPWTPESTTRVMFILALGLQQLGQQTHSREFLRESVGYYREVVTRWPLDRFLAYWFSAQNGLGVALGTLGRLEPTSVCLDEAYAIFSGLVARAANDGAPFRNVWASAQNNMGNALLSLGERETTMEKLEKATQAYQAALTQWTRNTFPLDWAVLQDNLGHALQIWGARSGRSELLASSVAAHRKALEEWKQDQVPTYWAQAQSNLGSALKALGEQQPGIELLEQAAAACRMALQEQVFADAPLAWGEAQNNLGAVLILIADRSGDSSGLEEAVKTLRESLRVRTRDAAPLAFASTQNNLGHALVRLGEFTGEKVHFEEAIGCLHSALEVWTRKTVPPRWSVAQQNLGDALVGLARKERRVEYLDQAVAAYREALLERDVDRERFLWASTQAALGQVSYLKGEWGSGTDSLDAAVKHYKDALDQYQNEAPGFAQAGIEFNLANALRLLGQRTNSPSLISEALDHHAAACQMCLSHSPYWALRAAEAADQDMNLLKGMSDSAAIGAAVAKHGWISTLWKTHLGHKIGLKSIFRVVVAGKSGMTKPDFSQADRKGEIIKDGTVVWENAGKHSYCAQCSKFLLPPGQQVSR